MPLGRFSFFQNRGLNFGVQNSPQMPSQQFMPSQAFPNQQGFQGLRGTIKQQLFFPQGFQGQQGFQAPQGFQGQQGFQAPQGFQGQQGFQAPQGFPGQQGFQAPQGFQGQSNPIFNQPGFNTRPVGQFGFGGQGATPNLGQGMPPVNMAAPVPEKKGIWDTIKGFFSKS